MAATCCKSIVVLSMWYVYNSEISIFAVTETVRVHTVIIACGGTEKRPADHISSYTIRFVAPEDQQRSQIEACPKVIL